MNNDQFRRLILDNSSSKSPQQTKASTSQDAAHSSGGATPALGSRMRSSIPMTPRTVTNPDFARQLADYRRSGEPPSKRFRSSAAPKGTKLPTGYQDRAAQLRTTSEDSENDLEKRVKALEEMVKLGQIEQGTFEKLCAELGVGGDLGSTHMVKGLDWELLKRVRAGEDVERVTQQEVVGDVDEEFEKLEGGEDGGALPSGPREKKEKKKKGVLAGKMSRDEILRQLRASRAAAAEAAAAELALGSKFKRIGGESKAEKKRWVEQDENGRRKEILQITDAQGKTKRKVRWLDKPGETSAALAPGLLVPDKDAKPLGMEVPAEVAAKAAAAMPSEDENDDIFAGVGADYNPLGDVGSDESSSDSDEDGEVGEKPARATEVEVPKEEQKPSGEAPAKPRNYFSTSTTDETAETDRSNPLTSDPTLLAALKRAAALRRTSPSAEEGDGEGEEGVNAETLQRRKKFLEEARRQEQLDAMDMDFGFGSSRVEDDEDEEVVLEEYGSKKRKRGPKKKKGDKDSVSDVMRVLEGRKKD
ncbi:hypothetical protein BBP40_005263 [Aspergillus hancockii]|nr:hypothetical protein BBP40_005263 [Aspergillus hancockii]